MSFVHQKLGKAAFVASVYQHLEAFHLPFIRLLQNKGYEVHAYAQADRSKERVSNSNVICHDLSIKRNPYHLDNLKSLKQLSESFKQEKFELVHVHTPVASILGRIAAKRAKVNRVIYTAHGFHFFKGAPFINWLLYYPIERIMARFTDDLITINEEDYIRSQKFQVRNRVHFVPGVGVDLKQFDFVDQKAIRKRLRQELGIKEEEIIVVYVAELIDRKNQRQLIECIKLLSEKNISIKCLLVGEGVQKQKLKDLVQRLNLNQNVEFLGYRRDIPELMITADVVALLSKQEGLPKALLEALAAGKPIITTNVRGNRDLVKDDENGFVVPVGDIAATSLAFEKLTCESKVGEKMGIESKKHAKNYDLEKIIVQMEQIYDRKKEINGETNFYDFRW